MEKIQLRHPAGKKAIRMDKDKYEILRRALFNCLRTQGESTHKEILQKIIQDFMINQTKFEGSVEWHMEWVKLDMEAERVIERIAESTPVKFRLADK